MNISDEAVEAAAAAYASGETGEDIWHHADSEAEARRRVRLILEAAAPYLGAAISAELADAPPANYEEDNYEAGYVEGLAFALDSLGVAK